MAKKKTHEKFIAEVYELVGDEYKVLGEYKGALTKIKVRHNCKDCDNHEWSILPSNFLKGARCPKCNKIKMTFSQKDFINIVKEKLGEDYEVLGEYKNAKTKIKIKHKNCEKYYFTTLDIIRMNCKCPYCSKNRVLNSELYKLELYNLVKDEYSLLSKYVNAKTKVRIRHNCSDCDNHEYEVAPSQFLGGSRCPKCMIKKNAKKNSKTNEEFIKEVYELVGEEYAVLSEYINAKTKLLMRHNKCGHEYVVNPNKFLTGRRCPACAESKGEQRIRKYLTENSYNFKQEYEFNDLVGIGGGLLRVDFIILDNSKPTIAIEYDGAFHYKIIQKYKDEPIELAKERLRIQRLHDKMKNEYCEKNNIKLIRIPYTEFDNIEEILDKELNLDRESV